MSINESMWIGVSGLMAHGEAMSVVGDNIANASTVGFKRERANFEDVLGGQLSNQRMGGGVFLGNAQTMFDQGGIQQTGNPLDMALQGNGMFVVSGSHDGVNGQFFTRAGQFQMDNKGTIVNQQGLALQGYAIDPATGVRSNTVGDLNIGARTSPPVATTTAQSTMQLDSTQPAIDPAIPFDPANPASYTYSTSEQVYDSLGNSHSVNMYYRKDAANSWSYHSSVDGADVGGTAGVQTEIGSGTLTFDTNGVLTSTNITGRPAGTITDMVVDPDGTITGRFSNGDTAKLAQVAVASFANEDGLQRDGDSLMSATTASGQALVDGASVGGRASISQGALEESNVDLSTELVTMISYQRAFEANSKTVTTADEMMTDVVNLIR